MKRTRSALFFLIIFSSVLFAQNEQTLIKKDEKAEVARSVSKILVDYYVFPQMGRKAAKLIEENSAKGIYDSINDAAEFADILTADVVSVTRDKHFRVVFDPQKVADEKQSVNAREKAEIRKKVLAEARRENFGFEELKILDGNIGYLNLTGFYDLTDARKTAAAALDFLSGADAVIIDLRSNHGGASDTARFISGWFLGAKPVLLFDFYARNGPNTEITKYFSLPVSSQENLADKDLYILTSNFTFSAAESVSYSLQNLKKAVIIGEKTGGGANMWTGEIVSERFYAHVPSSRPVDPRTQTNWEEIGVKPDIETSSKDALITAQITALEKLAVKFPARKSLYLWHSSALKAKLDPVQIENAILQNYVATYGDKEIRMENGKLFFIWRGANVEMIPLSKTIFRFDEFSFFRVKINTDEGKVTGLTIINDNGTSRTFARDKI